MQKAIIYLKAAAYLCLCALLLSLTLAVLQVREAVRSNSISQNASDLITEARKAVAVVNDSLLAKDSKDAQQRTAVREILDNAAGISRMAYQATKAQQDYWKTFPNQAQGTLTRVNALVDHLQGRTDSLMDNLIAITATDGPVNGVLTALKHDLETLDGTLGQTKQAIADLDANLLNDPDIKTILKRISDISINVDGISADLLKMADDSQVKYHALLFGKPSLKQRLMLGLDLVYKVVLIRAASGF